MNKNVIKKINICFHIANISNCGGTEKVTTQIASLLLKYYGNNYNVYILSNFYNIEEGPYFRENCDIKYYRLFENYTRVRLKPCETIKKIKDFVVKNDINILIGVDTILCSFDLPAVKNTKCKYIAWEHFNYYANLGVKLRDFGRWLAARKADALVVLTKKDFGYFSKNLKINTKLVQIYNPFIVKCDDSHKYNYDSNIIISTGRLTAQKGFDLLIEVASKVKNKYGNFKWIILGDGEDKQLLLNKLSDYHLEDNVIFKGKVKDIDSYYKKCKFFVLTSRFEGQVLVILEAKANKLPVISFDCNCGPSEMITDGVDGYLIPTFDLELMANKIVELLNDNEKCQLMSNNFMNKTNQFDEQIIIEKWNSLFNELIKNTVE